jgi:hypothetical protein
MVRVLNGDPVKPFYEHRGQQARADGTVMNTGVASNSCPLCERLRIIGDLIHER